jgi:hypothetical protein
MPFLIALIKRIVINLVVKKVIDEVKEEMEDTDEKK